jgi:hypothetical protein
MKPRKPVNPISAKRRREMKEYAKLRKTFLKDNPQCAVFANQKSTDVHHLRGRAGKLYLCPDYWLPVCRAAHHKINENPQWARDNNYLCAKGEWGKQP